ncbi:MAG: DUF1576 domain-containing protein [Defluviitaleaceae bacterium]|nr:DUF1576 domain-containing protein [Defluviitaleaceae bacterium]
MEKRVLEYRMWKPVEKMGVMVGFTLTLIIAALFSGSTTDVLAGLWRVLTYNNVLMTDYLYIGGLGGAFLNSGLLLLCCAFLLWINKAPFNGLSFGAVFAMLGLSFLGKNLINVWPIIAGVYVYAKYKKEPFLTYLNVALLATCMSPIVTEVLIHIYMPIALRPFAGIGVGVFLGFIIPVTVAMFLKVSEGNNLYNVGFTAGILLTVLASVFMSFGYEHVPNLFIADDYHFFLMFYIYGVSLCFILIGLLTDKHALRYTWRLMKRAGTLQTDFIALDGFSASLVNMGMTGILTLSYVLVVGGTLNGAVISGIFTVIGFGAVGKHPLNMWPVMAGVALGSVVKIWDISHFTPLMAATFGTAIAPIAGKYGVIAGVVAGFIHLSFVHRAAGFHAGLNLYNHGFAAGMTAMVMTPFLKAFVKPVKRPENLEDKYIKVS